MGEKTKNILFYTVVLLSVVIALPLESRAQTSSLDRLREKFDNGLVFHAAFEHKYTDSYTKETQKSEGMIWVNSTQYKVSSENQSVVVNGKTSMVYDANRNRVIISKYDPKEDDFAPSKMLHGADSAYTVQQEARNKGNISITLASDDPFSVFKKITIKMTDSLIPLSIDAIDQADNHIVTTFENGEFIRGNSTMFHLDYPDGAEIVDMRN